jgi:hypothetical protein
MLAAALVAAGSGLAAAGPSFKKTLVPRGMAAYEWRQADRLTPTQARQRMTVLRATGFQTIYLDIGSYLDAAELPTTDATRTARLLAVRRRLQTFVATATSLGLDVHALGGGPTWTQENHRYLGGKLVQLAGSYNLKVGPAERFKGVQLDIEPYAREGWFTNPGAGPGLQEYLTTVEEILAAYRPLLERSANRDLQLGFAIPFWFDARGDAPGPVAYPAMGGEVKPAVFHLIDLLGDLPSAYLVVMSYRNFTGTSNGSIAHARDEFRYAAQTGARLGLVVAQQYGPASPGEEHITFAGQPRRNLTRAAAAIITAFRRYPQFRGLAVDSVDAWLEAEP